MSNKRLPWIALGAVVLVTVVALVVWSQPDNSPSARAARLYEELACPVCDGQSVADSNAPEARQMRAAIPRMIDEGQSDREIRDGFARVYGDRVLLTPSNSGIGIIAWAIPVVVIVIGGAGIVLALRRWSRTPRLAAAPDDEAIVRRERELHDKVHE